MRGCWSKELDLCPFSLGQSWMPPIPPSAVQPPMGLALSMNATIKMKSLGPLCSVFSYCTYGVSAFHWIYLAISSIFLVLMEACSFEIWSSNNFLLKTYLETSYLCSCISLSKMAFLLLFLILGILFIFYKLE